MRKKSTTVFVFLLLLLSAMLAPSVLFAEEKGEIIIRDESRIYYGNPRQKVTNPAVIESSSIFNEIPAYQKIIKEKLTKKNPKYWILMEEANKVFKAALRKTARKLRLDLVAEKGAIERKGKEIPNITDKVIKAL